MDRIEFEAGCRAYQEHDPRDAMYKTATFLVKHFWGRPHEMADSLGVLLLTWNQAFYRYGLFDFDALEGCIAKNQRSLDAFRERNILSYTLADDEAINRLAHSDAALAQHAVVAGALHGQVGIEHGHLAEPAQSLPRGLEMGGTCTGEHGVGQAKIKYMHEEHSPETLNVMRAIKRALDPQNIMNPGKVLDA